jgi:hypothetical protein
VGKFGNLGIREFAILRTPPDFTEEYEAFTESFQTIFKRFQFPYKLESGLRTESVYPLMSVLLTPGMLFLTILLNGTNPHFVIISQLLRFTPLFFRLYS